MNVNLRLWHTANERFQSGIDRILAVEHRLRSRRRVEIVPRHASILEGRSRRHTLRAGGLERHRSLKGNRRALRRARSWRWEPPGSAATIADEHAQQRWAEARTKAITWAMAAIDDPRVIYLDTETTGFGPRAEIVDIAVVNAAGEVVLESLVQPNRRIPADATAIHGITNADVKNAPAWCELYEDLLRVLAGRRVIVYNVIFDRQMVNQACDRYSLPHLPRTGSARCASTPVFTAIGMRASAGTGSRSWSAPYSPLGPSQVGTVPPPMPLLAAPWCWAWPRRHPCPGSRRKPSPLDAKRTWHIPGERVAANPGNDRGATQTDSTSRENSHSMRTRAGRAPFSSSSRCSTRYRQSCASAPAPAEHGQCARSLHTAPAGMGSCPPAPPHRCRSDASQCGLQDRRIQRGKRSRTCSTGLGEDAGRAGQGEQYTGQGRPRHAGRRSYPGVACRARGRFRSACRRASALDQPDRDFHSQWPGADGEIGMRQIRSALKSVTAWHRINVLVRIPTTRLAPA